MSGATCSGASAATRAATPYKPQFFAAVALVMLLVACAGFFPSLIQISQRHAPVSPLVRLHGTLLFAWLIIFLVRAG